MTCNKCGKASIWDCICENKAITLCHFCGKSITASNYIKFSVCGSCFSDIKKDPKVLQRAREHIEKLQEDKTFKEGKS